VADENIEIDPERQLEIVALEAKVTNSNLYEFLGVPSGAPTEEVRSAFHTLSRKFHPDRYFGKNLGSFKARLDKVFRRLVEANQTLTDPEKLKAYLDAHPFVRAAIKASNPGAPAPVSAAAQTPEAAEREAERRARMARHPYLAKSGKINELIARAKAHVSKGEFSHAFTQLNLAIQHDPTHVEVKAMLVDVRKKNDELRAVEDFKRGNEAADRGEYDQAIMAYKASANAHLKNGEAAAKAAGLLETRRNDPKEASTYAQKAVEAAPENVEYRVLLGRLLETAGMKAMAKKHFEEAARLNPDHPDVKKYAKRRWPF
jgi:tetratricopeptide (TPR) repeat protein